MSNNTANRSSSRREDWGTPPDLFATLSTAHDFVIDLCASTENTLCLHWITEGMDIMSPRADKFVGLVSGLSAVDGDSRYAWLNPPYQGGGKTGLFVARAAELCLANGLGLVALIPASVGSRWWRECVDPFFDFVIFTPRLTFLGAPATAQFDSAVCVMRATGEMGAGPDPIHATLGALYRRIGVRSDA